MPFDGVKHGPALVDPIDHNSAAPMSGRAISNALQTAYFGARMHSRVMLQQTFGFNGQDAAANDTTGWILSTTSYVRIAESWAYLPRFATDVSAQISFQGLSQAAGAGRLTA